MDLTKGDMMTALGIVERNQVQMQMVFGDENMARARDMFHCEKLTHQQCWEAWFESSAFHEFNREYPQLVPKQAEEPVQEQVQAQAH